jgi:hypothetical protein
MPTDVSFGIIGGAGVVSAAQERALGYALLAAPTPGKENSGPRPGGPLIVGCVCLPVYLLLLLLMPGGSGHLLSLCG